MKKILFLTVFLATNLWANCGVYIPVKTYYHNAGYEITFNTDKLLGEKGYFEVNHPEDAQFVLLIKGEETEGTFHKAVTKMTLGSYEGTHSVTCFTQSCAVSDFIRSFNKSFKKLEKSLKRCE